MSRKKKLAIFSRPRSGFLWRTDKIRAFYKEHGWEVRIAAPGDPDLEKKAKGARHAYVWNGVNSYSRRATVVFQNSGARLFTMEHGHFPQRTHFHVAEGGLYGRHPGRLVNWDEVLTHSDWVNFQKERAARDVERNPCRDVMVPLQVGNDVQVVHFGNGYNNDYLAAVDLGPDKWLRHHPKNPRKHPAEKLDNRPLGEALASYDRVYGINSTVLLQAALWGLKVTAIGQSYLDWHPDPDVAIAAVLAMQVPNKTTDFTPWMRPHMGLQHLEEVFE